MKFWPKKKKKRKMTDNVVVPQSRIESCKPETMWLNRVTSRS